MNLLKEANRSVPAEGIEPSSPLYEGGASTIKLRRLSYALTSIKASDEQEVLADTTRPSEAQTKCRVEEGATPT